MNTSVLENDVLANELERCEEILANAETYLQMTTELVYDGLLDGADGKVHTMAEHTHQMILNASNMSETVLADAEVTHEGLGENIQRAARTASQFLKAALKRLLEIVRGWFGIGDKNAKKTADAYEEFVKNAKASDELLREADLTTGDEIPKEVFEIAASRNIRILRDENGKVIYSSEAYANLQRLLSRKVRGDINLILALSIGVRFDSLGQHLDDAIAWGKKSLAICQQSVLLELTKKLQGIRREQDMDEFFKTYLGTESRPGVLADHGQRMREHFGLTQKSVIGVISKYAFPGNVKVFAQNVSFMGTKVTSVKLIGDPAYTNGKIVPVTNSDYMPSNAGFMKKLRWPSIKEPELKGLLKQLAELQSLAKSYGDLSENLRQSAEAFGNDDGKTTIQLIERFTELKKESSRPGDYDRMIKGVNNIGQFLMIYATLPSHFAIIYSRYTHALSVILNDIFDGAKQ